MQGFPWRVLSKVAKFLTLRTQRNEEAARPIFHAEVSDLADRPHRGGWSGVGWGGTLPSQVLEAISVTPGVPVCPLFTRSAAPCSPDDNFNATQKGLRSYLNIHTKLPWAQLSR